jgi:hypothetical protein
MSQEKAALMSTYICHDCQQPVHSSDALLRSINFQRVAYCRDCWADNHGGVPSPRESREDIPAAQDA